MQVQTFFDELRNDFSGTMSKPVLATLMPGKTGLNCGLKEVHDSPFLFENGVSFQ